MATQEDITRAVAETVGAIYQLPDGGILYTRRNTRPDIIPVDILKTRSTRLSDTRSMKLFINGRACLATVEIYTQEGEGRGQQQQNDQRRGVQGGKFYIQVLSKPQALELDSFMKMQAVIREVAQERAQALHILTNTDTASRYPYENGSDKSYVLKVAASEAELRMPGQLGKMISDGVSQTNSALTRPTPRFQVREGGKKQVYPLRFCYGCPKSSIAQFQCLNIYAEQPRRKPPLIDLTLSSSVKAPDLPVCYMEQWMKVPKRSTRSKSQVTSVKSSSSNAITVPNNNSKISQRKDFSKEKCPVSYNPISISRPVSQFHGPLATSDRPNNSCRPLKTPTNPIRIFGTMKPQEKCVYPRIRPNNNASNSTKYNNGNSSMRNELAAIYRTASETLSSSKFKNYELLKSNEYQVYTKEEVIDSSYYQHQSDCYNIDTKQLDQISSVLFDNSVFLNEASVYNNKDSNALLTLEENSNSLLPMNTPDVVRSNVRGTNQSQSFEFPLSSIGLDERSLGGLASSLETPQHAFEYEENSDGTTVYTTPFHTLDLAWT